MKVIHSSEIVQAVSEACREIHFRLPTDILSALQRARQQEESPAGQQVLKDIIENAELAGQGTVALCQDTGMVVVFAELGQEVRLAGELLDDAINAGVRQAYREQPFRHSIVQDPLRRENTGDNTPAVVHLRLVPGSSLRLQIMAKGFGSENMSQVQMLTPAAGWSGVRQTVIAAVRQAGPNPCPPIVVGVGIGGTLDQVTMLAKQALLRPVGSQHEDVFYREKEAELLQALNHLGIGPGGLGGLHTCLGVQIQAAPTHIAGLPVAVNLQCHSDRHTEIELSGVEQ